MHLQQQAAQREANHYNAERERKTQMGDARVTPRICTTKGIVGLVRMDSFSTSTVVDGNSTPLLDRDRVRLLV
jgi:hypothetical protein